MLLYLIFALITLTFLLSVHFYEHFRLRCKYNITTQFGRSNRITPTSPFTPTSGNTVNSSILDAHMAAIKRSHKKNTGCCCSLTSADNEDFDFFPLAFLFYLLFLVILTITIIIIVCTNYTYSNNNENITDLIFGYSIKSYHNNSFSKLHNIHNTMNQNRHITYVIDYILIYSILILSIWESLFSYYRYYTTFVATHRFKVASCKNVFKQFPFYALIFIILFVIEIHVYYYIFPFTILYYCIFNCYCTYKFAIMLIERYKMFIDMEDNIGYQTEANQDILTSVIFMKKTSLTCCIIQSIYLSLFLFFYNVTIIYYLPILWSISSFISTVNFVRNRQYFRHQLLRIKQYFKCYRKVKANLNKTVRRLSLAPIQSIKARRQSKLNKDITEKIISSKNATDEINIPKTNTKFKNMSKSDPNIKSVQNNKYNEFNELLASKLDELQPLSLSLKTQSADIERHINKNGKKHSKKATPKSIDYPLSKHEFAQNFDSEPIEAPFKINLNTVRSNPVIIPKDNDEQKDISCDVTDKNNRPRSRSNASGVSSKRVSFILPQNHSNRSQTTNGTLTKKSSNTSSKGVSFALPNMNENELIEPGNVYLDLDEELMQHVHQQNMRRNKALELLGVSAQNSTMNSPIHSPKRSRNMPFKHSPKSRSKNNDGGTRTPTFRGILPALATKLSNKYSKSQSRSNMKKLWFVNVVSNELDNEDENSNEIDIINHNTTSNKSNTDDMKTPLPNDTEFELKVPKDGNKIDNSDVDDDGFEFVFGDGDDYMQHDMQVATHPVPKSKLIRHGQSTSAPVHLGVNIDEMVESFNILAKYGFCSRKSINSIKQLSKYQSKFNSKSHSKNLSIMGIDGMDIDENKEIDDDDDVGNHTVPFGKFYSTPLHSNRSTRL